MMTSSYQDMLGKVDPEVSAGILRVVGEERKARRASIRQLVAKFNSRAGADSPFDQERARVKAELHEAEAAEREAKGAVAEAQRVAERAERKFLRAADEDPHGSELVRLEAEFRDAEGQVADAQRQLAECRCVRERAEGAHLDVSRFA
jgi:hypothetical protein